jgi:hypothetical protein
MQQTLNAMSLLHNQPALTPTAWHCCAPASPLQEAANGAAAAAGAEAAAAVSHLFNKQRTPQQQQQQQQQPKQQQQQQQPRDAFDELFDPLTRSFASTSSTASSSELDAAGAVELAPGLLQQLQQLQLARLMPEALVAAFNGQGASKQPPKKLGRGKQEMVFYAELALLRQACVAGGCWLKRSCRQRCVPEYECSSPVSPCCC